MENKEMFLNGSTWLRADFHLHTKADKEFVYNGNENNYINDYISKLKEQEIGIGVITNHNKFDKNEFKELRKRAKKEGIGLFPGVELSVKDGECGIHCLIVFDCKSWITENEDYINQFLTSAFNGIGNRENENTHCNYSFETLLSELSLHKNKYSRDALIILAHVNHDKGFFKELGGSRIENLAKNEIFYQFVLGFQKVREYEKVSMCKKEWLNGRLPAFLEGSDCKNIEDIGKPHKQNDIEKKTFIKIGDFNFDALKIALIDYENRVKTDIKPETKNSYIESISFIGGKLDGKNIKFSPELNNLIGIRGSGKSSIIEILRYTLNIPLSDNINDKKYKDKLVEYIIASGGKIILNIIDKDKIRYKIEKIYGQKENIYYKNNSPENITIDGIIDSPIYFGQKDLSNKDNNFESDLLKRLIGTKLKDIQKEIENKKDEIKDIVYNLKKIKNISEKKTEIEDAINNAKNQLKIYEEKGIVEKLNQQNLYNSDNLYIDNHLSKIVDYNSELYTVYNDYFDFFKNGVKESSINEEIFNELKINFEELKSEFNKFQNIITNNNKLIEKLKSIKQKLEIKIENKQEEFATIKRELNTENINSDTYLNLNKQLETNNISLNEIIKLDKIKLELNSKLKNKLNDLNTLWEKEFDILKKEIEKLNNYESKIKINIEFKKDKDLFYKEIINIFKGFRVQDTTFNNIKGKYEDFISIYNDFENLKDVLNENHISPFKERFLENMDYLLTYKVENKITINYNGKSIEKLSLGQRASALILFLLLQKENNILIIDQPEDDLDNQTIFNDVIKEIKKIKGEMQFIFATHNANITVLGDSEKVISCKYNEDKIEINEGNIDNKDTQSNIVEIMEGGSEAFKLRNNIYKNWKLKK